MSRRPLSVVLAEGDHVKSLVALRDELAANMKRADIGVRPQYAARIQAVLAELAKFGNDVDAYRFALAALRDLLAVDMEAAEPNVKPQFAARLQAVLVALDELPPAVAKDPVDELARRRADRLATAVQVEHS